MLAIGIYLVGSVIAFVICLKRRATLDMTLAVTCAWPLIVVAAPIIAPIALLIKIYGKCSEKWQRDAEIDKIIREELE